MRKQLRAFAAILAGALWVFAVPMASPSSAATTAVHCESAASLQAAIDSASPGRTLWVSGTCVGNFVIAKNLQLLGAPATLDGNGTGSVVTILPGARVRIVGFTITNGLGTEIILDETQYPGAGGVQNHGNLTLASVSVVGNKGGQNGGVASWGGSTLAISNSRISGNTANGTGGLFVLASGMTPFPTLTNVQITDNSGGQTGGITLTGSGVFTGPPSITLIRSTVTGNSSPEQGGINLASQNANVTLIRSTVSGNSPCDVCPD